MAWCSGKARGKLYLIVVITDGMLLHYEAECMRSDRRIFNLPFVSLAIALGSEGVTVMLGGKDIPVL
jgi:sugar phosphate isomerase/epimerase